MSLTITTKIGLQAKNASLNRVNCLKSKICSEKSKTWQINSARQNWKTCSAKCHPTIRKSLAIIFQTCVNKRKNPTQWKLCQLTPIFKERNRADVSCYRPRKLLSKLLSLICSYLSEQKQMVKINKEISGPSKFTSDVPQGSLLRPLLFLIFINDLLDKIRKTSFSYADVLATPMPSKLLHETSPT